MKRRIDSKYEIVVDARCPAFPEIDKDIELKIEIRNSINGNVIPEDEPLFIFRAKDALSLPILLKYFCTCVLADCTKEQVHSLHDTVIEWAMWQKANANKLKQPGSSMPEDLKRIALRGAE